jgi:hypothetical protein
VWATGGRGRGFTVFLLFLVVVVVVRFWRTGGVATRQYGSGLCTRVGWAMAMGDGQKWCLTVSAVRGQVGFGASGAYRPLHLLVCSLTAWRKDFSFSDACEFKVSTVSWHDLLSGMV